MKRRGPGSLAGIAPIVAQQERSKLMARLGTRGDRVIARSRQIPDRLVRRVGHPDRSQIARARTLGQLQAVAPVGLDALARAPRNQRWGDHLTPITPGGQRSLQAIAGGARLVDHVHLGRRAQLGQRLEQLVDLVGGSPNLSRRDSATRLGCTNHDAVLVHIQCHENLDTFVHGRSPFLSLMTRSQRVARRASARNLRLRRPATPPQRRGDHDV
jgi:hypothetical protein